MTNAEKYLKDGVDLADLLEKLDEDLNWFRYEEALKGASLDFIKFFNAEERKPTLTEDERVILRNIDIDNYKGIGRKNDTLYLVSATPNYFGGENDKEVFWYCFHELFQFIKERRRILNRGVVKQ